MVAGRGMESGPGIKLTTTVHINSEIVPIAREIAICMHYSYWICVGDQCAYARDVRVLGVQGRATPFESSVGRETGEGGNPSEHHRLRSF